ncbi:uncharacterized protein VDAG_05507 [Verticillium dahliae VdLs.17]|uniref:Uncharacterized protein n=1 Tax=Verticillium dahliae (strain VdLs.17 / ATCC MYA-4575 / FGSC 10137) TaxID=498257 RepID=G2X5K2_VERDV|nr:uncharacterized protein VDAG_05507 [Verticillium dahliae VdLs.17]EGY14343.1 hypothetical protein VDAG_05507 [Verticillium dahliae VdLs.17]
MAGRTATSFSKSKACQALELSSMPVIRPLLALLHTRGWDDGAGEKHRRRGAWTLVHGAKSYRHDPRATSSALECDRGGALKGACGAYMNAKNTERRFLGCRCIHVCDGFTAYNPPKMSSSSSQPAELAMVRQGLYRDQVESQIDCDIPSVVSSHGPLGGHTAPASF